MLGFFPESLGRSIVKIAVSAMGNLKSQRPPPNEGRNALQLLQICCIANIIVSFGVVVDKLPRLLSAGREKERMQNMFNNLISCLNLFECNLKKEEEERNKFEKVDFPQVISD